MDIHIALACYGRINELVNKIRPNYPPNIRFIRITSAIPDEIKKEVESLEREGLVDVFVGSGGAGDNFHRYAKKTPVVIVRTSGFDLISAIDEAIPYCNKAAILMHKERIPQISKLKNILSINIFDYVYKNSYELSHIMEKLYNDGYEHFIGSTLVIEKAELMGATGHYIWSLKGLQEALDVAIQKDLQLRSQKMNLILKSIQEGIIVTDSTGIVVQYNDRAESILSVDLSSTLGTNIENIMPKISLNIANSKQNIDKIITANKTKIFANMSPIYNNNNIDGHVITFQSTKDISSKGEKIRNMYSRGFVANTCFSDIIGKSSGFLKMVNICKKYAEKDSTIMISGETGTGKELIAQSIHNASSRKKEQFVAINCATMSSDLLESELFGYEDGMFTGARKGGKQGLFELADGGTIFLDEIGEISHNFQTRLLRVLEQKEVMRIGGESISHVDIRIIAATNRDLYKLTKEKIFREDLFYRLNVLEVEVPPLRHRKDDIPLLILYFLRNYESIFDETCQKEIAHHYLFQLHDWPGNIRELSNVIERLCALYTRNDNLEELINCCMYQKNEIELENEEKRAIFNALKTCYGNREKTAQLLGISRTTLWRLIKKHNIEFQSSETV
jgi:propionate catabolism operon transcriptional regulator